MPHIQQISAGRGRSQPTHRTQKSAGQTLSHAAPDNAQLNIRSVYARDRAREVARRTGMTTTEISEDALRGTVPPTESDPADGLVRRGPILVKPAQGRSVTRNEADQVLEAVREHNFR